jgi:hypothetical protein
MDRSEVTDYLRRVPNLIEEAVQGLSDEDLRRRPSRDGWSILEICCHLRDYAEEEGTRIRRLVEEDGPTLEPYDEQVWATATTPTACAALFAPSGAASPTSLRG